MLDSWLGCAHITRMLETNVMTIRTRVMEILDEALTSGTEPSGKLAVLALELAGMTVVTRKFFDDVRYMVENADEDADVNDLRIFLHPIRQELKKLTAA
jgi:hypothetical protein